MAKQQAKSYESQDMTQARQVVQQDGKKVSAYGKFIKLSPPVFSITTRPTEVKGWIRRMESIFVVMGASEEQKVNLATFMLNNEACYWWETAKHLLVTLGDREVILWNPFVNAFNEKYFPLMYRKQKE